MTFTDQEKLEIRTALLAACSGALNKLDRDATLTHSDRHLLAEKAEIWLELSERFV